MKKIIGLSVAMMLAGCASVGAQQAGRPWMDKTLTPEKRADLLVKAMTLDEKILEIHMMDVKEHPREVAGVARLGIPVFKITNGPAGAGPGDAKPTTPATALPAAIGLAASWDPEMAREFGHVAGAEVRERGEDLIEGPGVNMTRVPQGGRNFEYFGEDPYLSGRLGVAEIEGIQSEGVMAEVKHFAANNQETARKTINEVIDERTLREIYLPAFEVCIKEANAAAVMAAYPSVNGDFCSQNVHLLKEILRGEWGFKGFVQSDYTGTQSATKGSNAGLDLSMKADHYAMEMKAAVEDKAVDEGIVDEMLRRRFGAMFRYGMFDETRKPVKIPAEKDGKLAREIADQCAVLLKNEGGILPLDAAKIRTIAVVGPYAKAASTGGGGSSEVKPLYTVSPVAGIQKRVGAGVKVLFVDGATISEAMSAAKAADVVLVMVGDKDSEGKDRKDLRLPGTQDALVTAVAAVNPRTVVVLKTGGPVLMPWVEKVPAIVEAWYPGEEDGNVVADVLFGDVNPSGKLPMTFPKTETEVPASTKAQWPGVKGVATYSEKMEIGYRWYDAQKVEPLFGFGYGLSYTTFELSNLRVPPFTERGMSVEVDVANTGKREGAEVVQVYVAAPASAGEPPKQLKGFAKVKLKAGETRAVTVPLDTRAFSMWDVGSNKWVVVPGRHEILVGDSSREVAVKGSVEVPAVTARK